MVERLVERHDCLGLAERLDEERIIGPTGAGVRNEADAAPVQELTTVDGTPDAGMLLHHDGQVGERHGACRVGQAMRQPALLLVLSSGVVPVVHVDPRALDDVDGTVHHRGAREHALVHDRVDPVVRLDDGNPLAAGHLQAAVARGTVAFVGLVHHGNARIARLELAQNGERAVLGAVV